MCPQQCCLGREESKRGPGCSGINSTKRGNEISLSPMCLASLPILLKHHHLTEIIDDTLINSRIPQIFKNPGATSKFQAPEFWHEADSILRVHKYQALRRHPIKCSRPGFVHPWTITTASPDSTVISITLQLNIAVGAVVLHLRQKLFPNLIFEWL